MIILNEKFEIVPESKQNVYVSLHSKYGKIYGVRSHQKIGLRFGIQSMDVVIILSSSLLPGQLSIPQEVIDTLKIPVSSRYEIIVKNNEMTIGPFIGLLVEKRKSRLNDKVRMLNSYVEEYEQIGGSIMAFSLEGVDKKNQTIEGLVFNPQKKQWEQGTFPFPSSIFKTIRWKRGWRNYFQSLLGTRIFNDYGFDKWEMYQWLITSPQLRDYLPETAKFNSMQDLDLLNRFDHVYLKPVNRSLGKGIMKLSKMGENIALFEKKAKKTRVTHFQELHELYSYLQHRIKRRKYIIQESLDLMTYQGKLIDFRLIVVKNEFGRWETLGIISRYGRMNHIVSNISSGGTAELGESTIMKLLNSTGTMALGFQNTMESIAVEAAKCVEKRGIHCGNLGVDMAIDKNKKIWIIEMNNNNPDHTIALDAGDHRLFQRTLTTIMLYAKSLAGFLE